ncbi:hypothetical protein LXA43DRAFT_973787 [Ganoderma leucocontextum]|nr:hypothetical protein LXA43DRAFT_973787 [Ganoderma leucocontextum]
MKVMPDRDIIPSESFTYDLVFHNTGIPVPHLRRVIHFQQSAGLIMDYIPGRQLVHVWPSLSVLGNLKLRVAFVEFHPRSLIPSPMAHDDEALRIQSPVFGVIGGPRGPFASYTDLSTYFNLNAKNQLALKLAPSRPAPFDDSRPLMLTHGDLNMRDILVRDNGRLWLLDSGTAGFYPEWFEYRRDRTWRFLTPFICGPYFRQRRWYDFMYSTLEYA